jgi:hypothetical protein
MLNCSKAHMVCLLALTSLQLHMLWKADSSAESSPDRDCTSAHFQHSNRKQDNSSWQLVDVTQRQELAMTTNTSSKQ